MKRPEVKLVFQLDNGVRLALSGHARCILSSNRVDARIIGIDWDTIFTNLFLDIPFGSTSLGYIRPLIDVCLDDEDESHLDEQIAELVTILGSPGSAEKIKKAFLLVREKVLAKRNLTEEV